MALRLSFTIEAIDRATARVRAVSNAVGRFTAPVRRLQESLKALGAASGLPKLAAQAGEIRNRFDGVTNSLRSVRNAMLVVTGAGAGMFFALKRTADAGDQAVDTAEKLGMTVPEWQRLAHLASVAKMPQEELADSLAFLGKNAVEAALGSEQSAIWFRRAGIEVKDANGKVKSTNQLFREFADAIKKMPDGPKKIALTMALMNRSGDDMIEVLNGGSEAIDRYAREAEALGKVNEQAAREGEAFGKGLAGLTGAFDGLMNSIAVFALPVLTQLMGQIKTWIAANRELIATKVKDFIDAVVKGLPDFIEGVKTLGRALFDISRALNAVAQFFGGWGNVLKIVAAVIVFKAVIALALLTKAVIAFGVALAATPLGWIILGIAALAAAVTLLYLNWGPVSDFFTGLWEDIKGAFSGNIDSIVSMLKRFVRIALFPLIQTLELVNQMLPDSVKSSGFGRGLQASLDWVHNRPVQPVFGNGQGMPGQANVGGTIRVEVASKLPVKVREISSETPGVDFDVETGMVMP